jgi:predicted aspartyl protease
MTRKPRPIALINSPLSLVLVVICASVCASVFTACSTPEPPPPKLPTLPALPPLAVKANRPPVISPLYQQAIATAGRATQLSKKAQSAEDWQVIIQQWQASIVLMKQVPANDANHAAAIQSLDLLNEGMSRSQAELQRIQENNQDEAIAQASRTKATQALEEATERLQEQTKLTPAAIKNRTYYATIKSYKSGIPLIDVTFNGSLHFEMMVDTGASSTMITESMSKALNVETLTYVTANTPSGETKFPVGYVNSIAVGNDPAQNTVQEVPVAIGPVALLGHDFFGDCNISIKRDQNIVEFSQCR